MKNQELFDKTVGILVKAYVNNTLQHGNCCACACGNLVAEGCGLKILNDGERLVWSNGLESGKVGWWKGRGGMNHTDVGDFNITTIVNETKQEIESTGYSYKDFFMIEMVFESKSPTYEEDQDGYLGLMAVVDYLIKVHEATPEQATEAKKLFTLAEVG